MDWGWITDWGWMPGALSGMDFLAVVLSVLALFVSWRAYRRSGARVKVLGVHQTWNTPAVNESARALIAVDVRKSGQSEIQIAAGDLEIVGSDESAPLAVGGILRGLYTGTFRTHASDVLEAARLPVETGGKVRCRVRLTLGNGKTVRGRWLTLTVPPDPGRL